MRRSFPSRVALAAGCALAAALACGLALGGCELALDTASLTERSGDGGGEDGTIAAEGGGEGGLDSSGPDTTVTETGADAREDSPVSEAGSDGAQDAPADGSADAPDAGPACTIGGMPYSAGQANPSNACQTCQPAVSTTSWTSKPDGSSCGFPTASCFGGACKSPPSCTKSGTGFTDCGPNGQTCCTSFPVAGGSFNRTYTNTGSGPTGESAPATISSFRLDAYLVTVARFREFVTAYAGGTGWTPSAGAGKHTHLNGGQGLVNVAKPDAGIVYETGWNPSDNTNLSLSNTDLACGGTWSVPPTTNDNLPIDCANWYEAYAFCIWDGGFLPTATEWEYAAAGGSQERQYPWGSTAPGTGSQYAIYGCYYPSGTTSCNNPITNLSYVGLASAGAGLWGQLDLVGELYEWSLDIYPGSAQCTDCASLYGFSRAIAGSYYGSGVTSLSPANNISSSSDTPTNRYTATGFRCARLP